MDRGAWQATVYRVTKSRTQLKRLSTKSLDVGKKILFLATTVIESAVISVLPNITWRWLNPSTFPPPNHLLNKKSLLIFKFNGD